MQLIARAGVNDEVVYRVTRAIVENGIYMVGSIPTVGHHDRASAGWAPRCRFNPGAYRYYAELGAVDVPNPPLESSGRPKPASYPRIHRRRPTSSTSPRGDATLDERGIGQIAAACGIAAARAQARSGSSPGRVRRVTR